MVLAASKVIVLGRQEELSGALQHCTIRISGSHDSPDDSGATEQLKMRNCHIFSKTSLHIFLIKKNMRGRSRMTQLFKGAGPLYHIKVTMFWLYFGVFPINTLRVFNFLKTLEVFPNKNIKILFKLEIISVRLRY